jgi:hypothetical protein
MAIERMSELLCVNMRRGVRLPGQRDYAATVARG